MNVRGGQVVNVLTFHYDHTSSNPAEAYNFYNVKLLWKERLTTDKDLKTREKNSERQRARLN